MIKLVSGIFAFVVMFVISFTPLSATEHDGNPSLCGTPWESEGSTSSAVETKRSRRITSECQVIDPDTLDVSSSLPLAAFLAEVTKELWETERLPKGVLYRYTLMIINDWGKDISINLSHWQVVHSPYTLVAKSFSVDIPACSYARLQFLSLWAPELYGSPVNIVTVENGEWSTIGDGSASIVTPVWYQYYSEGMVRGPLSSDEAKTKTCSSTK